MNANEALAQIDEIIDRLRHTEDYDSKLILMTLYTIKGTMLGYEGFKPILMDTLAEYNRMCVMMYEQGRESPQ
jgi:hypothetical protein